MHWVLFVTLFVVGFGGIQYGRWRERIVLRKRPVAWRVKDYADGWILFSDEDQADEESSRTDAVLQGLYVRDGT